MFSVGEALFLFISNSNIAGHLRRLQRVMTHPGLNGNWAPDPSSYRTRRSLEVHPEKILGHVGPTQAPEKNIVAACSKETIPNRKALKYLGKKHSGRSYHKCGPKNRQDAELACVPTTTRLFLSPPVRVCAGLA